MSQKFYSDIEVKAGLRDSSGSLGASGQILSSTSGNVSWVTPTVNTVARDVQNEVKAGVAINKGQAVYVTGADGTNIIVGLASNTSEATSSKTLGLLNATVAVNGFADVVQIGRLAGLNTIGATAGDPVWLGTNGNLIYGLINKPYAPAHLVFLGIVTRVNASNGEIFVNVQNGFELKEIHDVDIITNVPINGDILGYDGTLWVNKTIAEWLGYTPANASGTTNYVSKFTGTTTLGNSQIFDNGTNVGISTVSPSQKLEVNGTILSTDGSFGTLALGAISTRIEGNAATREMKFYTFNSEKMIIDGLGNVGIGTSSPSSLLSVAGNATFGQGANRPVTYDSNAGNFRITANTGGWAMGYYFNGSSGTYRGGFGAYGGADDLGWYFIGSDYNASTATYFLPNGNVGIGTSNPSAKLDTNGDGVFGKQDYLYQAIQKVLTLRGDAVSGVYAGNSYRFYTTPGALNSAQKLSIRSEYNGSESSDLMTILGNGNVGIGTTSPTKRLDVVSSTNDSFDAIVVRPNNQTQTLNIGWQGIATSLNFIVSTNGSEKMRVTTAGNIGVGTASPNSSAILHLRSTTQGFLPPVMRTGERDSIGSPAAGLMIFNEDDEVVQVYTNGGGWKTLAWA